MKTFRDLKVWQRSMDLVVEIYQVTDSLPKTEDYGLTSQIRRSSTSIPSNIAEGFGRNHSKEFVRFLQIAQGSVYECQTQLEIACRVNYIAETIFRDLDNRYIEIAKMISSLIRKITESNNKR